ncbi:MAG: DUF4062 domain-containing protein [Rhodobacteraceae bacterium]|nr:DUF4062 domain-containing protein [Paracoccaceae bacterium]
MARHEAVFVSSPVDDLENFRESVRKSLLSLSARFSGRAFLFYMYELHFADRMRGPHQNYAEMIVQHCDDGWEETPCTLFILFFSHRIGNGTRREFELFKERFRREEQPVRLWWKKLDTGDDDDPEVADFMEELYEYGEMVPDDSQYDHNNPVEFGPYVMSALFQRAMSKKYARR